MRRIPVVSSTGKPLDPCNNHRANELIAKGKALRRFSKGVFYIRLTERADGVVHPTAASFDPGIKKDGVTVKSGKHTLLNIQADAVTWVKGAEETSTMMRRSRRSRKCPCRQPRQNRSQGSLTPSIRARWGMMLNMAKWLCKLYPISVIVVEDVSAVTKPGKRRWNESFSPLEVGKNWFYGELEKLAPVRIFKGWETKNAREGLGLKKLSNKLSNKFEAHCVDSWVLAIMAVGGHLKPDNKSMLYVSPIRLHRRQLHALQPIKGGVRRPYGGTRSMGFKRGSWVKHEKYGVCYVGGTSRGRISLHEIRTGERLTRSVRAEECQMLAFGSWRVWKGDAANSPAA